MSQAKVAFVVMPFGTVQYPSIQAGLLKAIAERDGIKVDCHYLIPRALAVDSNGIPIGMAA